MIRVCLYFLLSSLLSLGVITTASAENLFDISYEKKIVSSDEDTVSCVIILHIANMSGQNVQDVVASLTGMNDVTYDNHNIMVGDLADFRSVGIFDEFSIPSFMTELETPAGEPVIWRVEYTGQDGIRYEVEVDSRVI